MQPSTCSSKYHSAQPQFPSFVRITTLPPPFLHHSNSSRPVSSTAPISRFQMSHISRQTGPSPTSTSTLATSTIASATSIDQPVQNTNSPIFPLTTIFTPSPRCFSDLALFTFFGSSSYAIANVTDFVNCCFGLQSATTCLPIRWTFADYFSPGICPHGYTTACSSTNVVGTVSETIATCCPKLVLHSLLLIYLVLGQNEL